MDASLELVAPAALDVPITVVPLADVTTPVITDPTMVTDLEVVTCVVEAAGDTAETMLVPPGGRTSKVEVINVVGAVGVGD